MIKAYWVRQPVLIFIFLLVSTSSCSAASQNETGNTVQSLPESKVLESGHVLRRNAGTEWSREKIREYLSKIKLTYSPKVSSGSSKCLAALPDIENQNFQFIDPNIVTDDWNDPRLDEYKTSFKDFEYGMGYLESYGPENPMIPTWNINVYRIDKDEDNVDEVVLYGEKINARLGGPTFTGYNLYNAELGLQATGEIGDKPSSVSFTTDDYVLSGLIRLKDGTYASLSIADFELNASQRWTKVLVHFFKVKNTYKPELGHSTWRCQYKFTFKETLIQ